MSVIKLPLLFVGSKGEKNLYTLFDSDLNLSCIHPNHVEGLESPIALHSARVITKEIKEYYTEATERVSLDFYVDGILLSDEFFLIPGLSEEVFIGAATMRKWRIKLNFKYNKAEVDPRVAVMQLK